ncbi:uncharacterized protein LOC108820614 [Raphanus sativus]|uniref:Uncharacterized protein LOC108820614 n=1 Tax=Raphanus sativus TaxID=3726 RepID=A0A6J0KPX9_RAPSA|nr:uncharacterized protein LOC108820614 [Raphanus sativus]XP_018449107.1 uncharacterized protein LOC108820614 [Raphanus sativus]
MEVQNNANFRTQALGPTVNTDVNGEEEGDNAHPKRDGRVASVLEGSHGRISNSTSLMNNKDQPLEDDFLSSNSHTKESTKVSSRAELNDNNVSREILGEVSERSYNLVLSGSANSQIDLGVPKTAGPSSSVLVNTEAITPLINPSPHDMIDTVAEHSEEESEDDPSQPLLSPKSKRTKVLPSELVQENESGVNILNRAREAEPLFTAYSDPDLVMSKYTKLLGN